MKVGRSSIIVDKCQISGSTSRQSVIFLGYLPAVNNLISVTGNLQEQPVYPTELLFYPESKLGQLGISIDPKILFPSSYPYTSSTTASLRKNFEQLYDETKQSFKLAVDDLVIDIGSNDGNLLGNFKDNHRVLGITPEDVGKIAIDQGIPTILDYFSEEVTLKAINEHGQAKIVTATNVFAHMENVNEVVRLILKLLQNDGIFITESHYFFSIIDNLQYDTVYHEHLRYYTLTSLRNLFDRHGLEIIKVRHIDTHGGSIRVYAARSGVFSVDESVERFLTTEKYKFQNADLFSKFRDRVILSKTKLFSLVHEIKMRGEKIYGIGAPSRASTLINYLGLDDGIVDCVLELEGSRKIGHYVPGTVIPIVEESNLFSDRPEYAILFSWHIGDEIMKALRSKGYAGKFILPLPDPKIVN